MKVGDLVKDKYDTAPGIVMDTDFCKEMPIRVYYKHTGEFSAYYGPEDLEIVGRYKDKQVLIFSSIFFTLGIIVGIFL